jgi:hypothetical protein
MLTKFCAGRSLGNIPVEQPTKFDLVINLTTAKTLGLTIPESFLLRADREQPQRYKRIQRNGPKCYRCGDQLACREMAVLFQHPRESTSAVEARHPRRRARIPRWCHTSRQGFGSVAVVRILA